MGVQTGSKKGFSIKPIGVSRDWLTCKIPMRWEEAKPWFESALGNVAATAAPFDPPARSGYKHGLKAADLVEGGRVSLQGDHPEARGWALLEATGQSAEWGWNLAAATSEQCQVNRVDAAFDFKCSQQAFDRMMVKGVSICRDFGRRPFRVGETEEGRTLYFNWKAPPILGKSETHKAPMFSARLYEKGKEQGQDPDWRRWEVTVRPDKEAAKLRTFLMEPAAILAAPSWSRAFLGEIGYNGSMARAPRERGPGEVVATGDARRSQLMWAIGHMTRQFGKTARELADLVGEDEAAKICLRALFETEVLDDGSVVPVGEKWARDEATKLHDASFADDLRRRESRYFGGAMTDVKKSLN